MNIASYKWSIKLGILILLPFIAYVAVIKKTVTLYNKIDSSHKIIGAIKTDDMCEIQNECNEVFSNPNEILDIINCFGCKIKAYKPDMTSTDYGMNLNTLEITLEGDFVQTVCLLDSIENNIKKIDNIKIVSVMYKAANVQEATNNGSVDMTMVLQEIL